LRYLPVGFGSHHWAASDAAGMSWFVTVDEIADNDAALRAALETAADLRAAGCAFVVAPVRTSVGAVLARYGDFAVALYPHVDGETYAYGDFQSEAHRQAVLDILVALHAVPHAVAEHASRDGFAIPHRAALEHALDAGVAAGSGGPYAVPSAQLLTRNGAAIRGALAEYDGHVAGIDVAARPFVVTHGEPHGGNTIRTSDGWVLVDWDTTLVAPRERDLWSLVGDDESIGAAYAEATGVTPSAAALSLYSLRWDLAEIAVYAERFRRRHEGDADDDKSWEGLVASVENVVA
jgi:spectinomycin phosphotransferase/16S rRNA (guanine(1405)-N(7))-methyltransferase